MKDLIARMNKAETPADGAEILREYIEKAKPGTYVVDLGDFSSPGDAVKWKSYCDGVSDYRKNLLKEIK